MAEAVGDNEEMEFEHYTPNHPLPEEIRQMKRDDTVCRYCGVSYLIHNEIKALEKKLKEVENELEHYRGSVERERGLKQRVEDLEKQETDLRQALTAKDGVISTLQSDVKSREEMIKKMCSTNKDLEQKLSETIGTKEMLRMKLDICKSRLPSVLSEVKHQRKCLSELQTLVQLEYKTVLDKASDKLISELRQKEKLNTQIYESKLAELQTEKLDMENRTKHSEESSREQTEELIRRCEELQQALDQKTAEMEKSVSSLRMLTLEVEQFKDNVKVKNQDIENLNAQLRQNTSSHEQAVKRLHGELEQRQKDLQVSQKQFKDLSNQLQEHQNLEKEIQRRASISISQTQELKGRYDRAQMDLEALKAERELMIEAHQNRISELKESFKNKMFEAEKWPEKLEAALKKERERHNSDMTALEEKLKENFILEMQIEKQKHRELLQEYLEKYKEKENKYKVQIGDLESQLRSAGADHQKLLDDLKNRAAETETKLRKEIENLKSIIRDLEERLAKAGTGGEDKVLSLKEELLDTKDSLLNYQQEVKAVQQQLDSKSQEVGPWCCFLQETVRKECEERFELTEALSEGQRAAPGPQKTPGESLLLHRPSKQSAGSVTPSNHRNGTANLSGRSSQNFGLIGSPDRFRKLATGGLDVTSTNINMEFEKSPAKPSGKLKGKSIAENRRRITMLLGKK
ncbi:hyaluronan mediated motility receptor-like [Liolophura sinensis]|uniref:hyaluronan mediated motility receptor-like n=1 Tax=Liolophura sinensis TaxID=3198878 RepID=UPI0031593195